MMIRTFHFWVDCSFIKGYCALTFTSGAGCHSQPDDELGDYAACVLCLLPLHHCQGNCLPSHFSDKSYITLYVYIASLVEKPFLPCEGGTLISADSLKLLSFYRVRNAALPCQTPHYQPLSSTQYKLFKAEHNQSCIMLAKTK